MSQDVSHGTKEAEKINERERSSSRGPFNGTDTAKRGRETGGEDDNETITKKSDLRNPFAKVEGKFSFEDDTDSSGQKMGYQTFVDSPDSDARDSKEKVQNPEEAEDSSSSTSARRATNPSRTPVALLRRMSIENRFVNSGFVKPHSPARERSPDNAIQRAKVPDLPATDTAAGSKSPDRSGPQSDVFGQPPPREQEEVDGTPDFSLLSTTDARQTPPPPEDRPNVDTGKPRGDGKLSDDPSQSSTFVFGQNLDSRVTAAAVSVPSFAGFSGFGSGSDKAAFSGFGFAKSGFGQLGSVESEKSTTPPAGFLFAQALLQAQKESDTKKVQEGSENGNEDSKSTADAAASSQHFTGNQGSFQNADENGDVGHGGTGKEKVALSLSESARIYDSKQQKPLLDEVNVVTGEEGESNVFEINVKLYVYDKDSQQWRERGRAITRLNDAHDASYSRLVVRMSKTLRIIINVKLWKDMIVKKLSDKNVSFTAVDAAEENLPRVFLITCSASDAQMFFSEINYRIDLAKSEDKSRAKDDSDASGPIESLRITETSVVIPQSTKKLKADEQQ